MQWLFDDSIIDWVELSTLYRIAPLGEKKPDDLKLAFANSRYKCFVRDAGALVGAGRALADGVDCSYLCDVAVHPEFQGRGLGTAIIAKLKELSAGHRKIILYANPAKKASTRNWASSPCARPWLSSKTRNARSARACWTARDSSLPRGLCRSIAKRIVADSFSAPPPRTCRT